MLSQEQVHDLRRDFPALQQINPSNSRPPVYLDNSCVTLTPLPVAEAIWNYNTRHPGCGGHRSSHWFSAVTTEKVDDARRALAEFLGVPPILNSQGEAVHPLIFTRNTSESLNLVANSFGLLEGETVVITNKEHNSNLCPWQEFERRGGRLRFVHVKQDNTFDLETFRSTVEEDHTVKLVALHHSSNLDGVSVPLGDVVRMVREIEARQGRQIYICVDGAQSTPHMPVNLGHCDRDDHLDVDFYAGSLHKMLGPSGVGFLYARPECLDCLRPFLVGGSTIFETSVFHRPIYAEWPERFEAGLQNYGGLHGAGSAARYLAPLIPEVKPYESHLNGIMTDLLAPLFSSGRIGIIGPSDARLRGNVTTIVVPEGGDGECVRRFEEGALDWNLMFRSGQFCVDAWFSTRAQDLPETYTAIRFSFYLYNTEEEVEIAANLVKKAFS